MRKGLRITALLVLLAVMLLAAPLQTMAVETVNPGDSVTATINWSSSTPIITAEVGYTLSSGLTWVSTKATGLSTMAPGAKKAVGLDMSGEGVTSGSFTVTAKVNDDATGEQSIVFSSISGAPDTERILTIAAGKTVTYSVKTDDEIWGEWVVTKEATHDEEGSKKRTSNLGNEQTEVIPKTECVWGDWNEVTAPTCTKEGSEERVCTLNPAHKETRAIDPLGHDWGEWQEIAPATCTDKGSEKRVCKRDAAHTETRDIDPLGHDWGEWQEITPATCTDKGSEKRVCKRDATHTETRDIDPLGHVEGPWEVEREPTEDMPGERVKRCTRCRVVMEVEAIPYRIMYYDNTASTQGPRFRDLRPELTKKWYMFTPVDLSQDGVQEIEVLAANRYYIGKVILKVSGGMVTIEPKLVRGVNVKSQFVTLFPSLSEVTAVEPEQIGESLPFGEPIAVGEDTKVLLFAHFVVDYHDHLPGVRVFYHGEAAHRQLVEKLLGLMD